MNEHEANKAMADWDMYKASAVLLLHDGEAGIFVFHVEHDEIETAARFPTTDGIERFFQWLDKPAKIALVVSVITREFVRLGLFQSKLDADVAGVLAAAGILNSVQEYLDGSDAAELSMLARAARLLTVHLSMLVKDVSNQPN